MAAARRLYATRVPPRWRMVAYYLGLTGIGVSSAWGTLADVLAWGIGYTMLGLAGVRYRMSGRPRQESWILKGLAIMAASQGIALCSSGQWFAGSRLVIALLMMWDYASMYRHASRVH